MLCPKRFILKIAVICDIHQSIFWRKIIDQTDDFDKIIFLGDEFDSWDNIWPLQMDNAQDIINFKKEFPDKVDLCWSNHAISYFLDERCSGHQNKNAFVIENFYNKNKSLYNVMYVYDNWIFSHAGVSAKWMKSCGINDINEINQLFTDAPDYFRWIGPDGYGNNANEGPLWIRPDALVNNYVTGFNQVAGHTEYTLPRIVKKADQIFVFCDTPDHNFLTVLDTVSNEIEFVNLM